MTQKHYVCLDNDFKAAAGSQRAAWQLIRNQCKEKRVPVPTMDRVLECVPMYLWGIFAQILGPDITGGQASVIYEEARGEWHNFREWAMKTHKCGEKEALQLYKECERTREEN